MTTATAITMVTATKIHRCGDFVDHGCADEASLGVSDIVGASCQQFVMPGADIIPGPVQVTSAFRAHSRGVS